MSKSDHVNKRIIYYCAMIISRSQLSLLSSDSCICKESKAKNQGYCQSCWSRVQNRITIWSSSSSSNLLVFSFTQPNKISQLVRLMKKQKKERERISRLATSEKKYTPWLASWYYSLVRISRGWSFKQSVDQQLLLAKLSKSFTAFNSTERLKSPKGNWFFTQMIRKFMLMIAWILLLCHKGMQRNYFQFTAAHRMMHWMLPLNLVWGRHSLIVIAAQS